MKKTLILLLLVFLTHVLHSQDVNLKTIKTETEYFPRLVTTIQIYNNSDEPVIGLKKENFAVTVDGNNTDSLNVITYKESGLGFNILLCLDISGTMKGSPLHTVKNAVNKFIDEMRTVDKLAIIGFADEPELISDFSNDKEYLRSKVNGVRSKGSQTALYYAGYKGLKKLVEIQEKIAKILIIMGDGKNDSKSSSYTEDDIIDLALKEGIPVFNIGYTKIDKVYLQSLERISDKTNGKFYESPNDEELDRQYHKLYRQLLNIYLLSYQICGMEGDGNEHLNSISVFMNEKLQKSLTNKFISPAGTPAVKCDEIIIKNATGISIWYYIIPALILILVILSVVYLRIRKKHKLTDEEENNVVQEPFEKIEEEDSPVIDAGKEQSQSESTVIYTNQNNYESSSLIIEIKKGEHSGEKFELLKKGATIGRNTENVISLSNSPTVSSIHAEIIYLNGSFSIEDKESTNGTYINGRKILVHSIKDGDIWKIGSCEGVFHVK